MTTVRTATATATALALVAAGLAAGCGGPRARWGDGWDPVAHDGPWTLPPPEPGDAAPTVSLTPAAREADRATVAALAATRARVEALVARAAPAAHPVEEVARAVAACHRAAARDAARALVDGHPRVVAWDALDGLALVEARFDGAGVELTVTRAEPSARLPIAVVVPPGTIAAPVVGDRRGDGLDALLAGGDWTTPEDDRRWGGWPEAQDLALLRAPVVVLGRGEVRRTVRVPVACASFHRGAPVPGQPCALARAPEGSALDRLLVTLCAEAEGDAPPTAACAQLAVWVASDDVAWDEFAAEGGDRGRLVTFGTHVPVRARHAEGAARLLGRAGVAPEARRFFGGPGAPDADPAPPAAPAPAAPPPALDAAPPGLS